MGERFSTVLLPEGVVSIGRAAFLASCVENITFPDSLLEIGDDAFSGCICLKNIYLPHKLTGIGTRAFMGCDGISELVIPKSIEYIGDEAFAFCRNLKRVFLPTHFEIGQNVFHHNHPGIIITKYQKGEDLPFGYSCT